MPCLLLQNSKSKITYISKSFNACPMALASEYPIFFGKSAIAIHDETNMPWQMAGLKKGNERLLKNLKIE